MHKVVWLVRDRQASVGMDALLTDAERRVAERRAEHGIRDDRDPQGWPVIAEPWTIAPPSGLQPFVRNARHEGAAGGHHPHQRVRVPGPRRRRVRHRQRERRGGEGSARRCIGRPSDAGVQVAPAPWRHPHSGHDRGDLRGCPVLHNVALRSVRTVANRRGNGAAG